MYKTYNIRPKIPSQFNRLPEEYQVIFQWSKMQLGASRTQTVTTCLFREKIEVVAGGFSIENPGDERDDENELGIQWSFKRAIKSLLRNYKYSNVPKAGITVVDRAFRTALYKARNKNEN